MLGKLYFLARHVYYADIFQNNPTVLKLKDDKGRISTVKISLKYIPIKMQLDPSESINNMGTLRVDVLDGSDLPSADRNGYSDPFCKFELNGSTVFKTQTQKKTLHPAWNEFFETEIPSRTAAQFKVRVYDWDFASDADLLGCADVNLAVLDPFTPKEMKLTLDGKSGSIRIRCLFKPNYVTRSTRGTSTFSGTFAVPGKIVTGVAGAPIKGVGLAAGGIGAGASFVGSNVGKGAKFITSGFRSKKDKKDSVPVINADDLAAANGKEPAAPTPGFNLTGADGRPTTANGDGSPFGGSLNVNHSRNKSNGNASIYSTTGNAPTGTASFTIISAEGYPTSANVMVTIKQLPKEKTVFKSKHLKSSSGLVKFDESFDTKCTADTQFQVIVKDHATFGSDEILGTTLCFVDDSGSGGEKTVQVGPGRVVMRSNFVGKEGGGLLAPGSPTSQRTTSGGMRKSFLSKRNVSGAQEGRMSYSRDG